MRTSNISVQNKSIKDDGMLAQKVLTNFVHGLIHDNKTVEPEGFTLFVSDLSFYDQKLFLSHLVDADDFEDYNANETRMRAALKEYRPRMQKLVNNEIDEVYYESQHNAGFSE